MSDASAERALSTERVARELTTQRYGRSLQYLPSTESTNDDARRAIERDAASGHVVLADAQTRGRGSRGRSWSSPAGNDLYLSIVDRPAVAIAELPPLTLAVGLGVAEAAELLLGTDLASSCQVKWPNDVWISGRKCAGILVEANSGANGIEALVIGIGLNLNRTEFPAELGQATSLRLASTAQTPLDRTTALCVLLASVERWVDRFVREGAASIAQALTPKLALLGRRARCAEVAGIVRGVSPSGALLLDTGQDLVSVIAGRLEAADEQEC
jgi:BirA family biotin operon repressor/biotin-[acetyl-CoA-carboxylase] ligase